MKDETSRGAILSRVKNALGYLPNEPSPIRGELEMLYWEVERAAALSSPCGEPIVAYARPDFAEALAVNLSTSISQKVGRLTTRRIFIFDALPTEETVT